MSRLESWIGKGTQKVKTSPERLKTLNKHVKKSNIKPQKQMTLPLD